MSGSCESWKQVFYGLVLLGVLLLLFGCGVFFLLIFFFLFKFLVFFYIRGLILNREGAYL